MWGQPAPWLQTFLQWPAATATGWWLHPAVWGKTSPPPSPLSSVSQTGSIFKSSRNHVIKRYGVLRDGASWIIYYYHPSRFWVFFCLFLFVFFSLFFPRRGTVSTSWGSLLLIPRGMQQMLIDGKQSVLEVRFRCKLMFSDSEKILFWHTIHFPGFSFKIPFKRITLTINLVQ